MPWLEGACRSPHHRRLVLEFKTTRRRTNHLRNTRAPIPIVLLRHRVAPDGYQGFQEDAKDEAVPGRLVDASLGRVAGFA